MTEAFSLQPDYYFPIRADLYGALDRYLNQGIMPGGFLTAVLENNLCEAFGRADSENQENLKNIIGYIYNNIPSAAWGSRSKIEAWLLRFEVAKAEGD